jgi:hypothetical protein
VNAFRIGLPLVICLVGLGLAIAGGEDTVVGAGVVFVGVGLLVALVNALMRLGIQSERDRDREQRAREYFDRHGRWPGGNPR